MDFKALLSAPSSMNGQGEIRSSEWHSLKRWWWGGDYILIHNLMQQGKACQNLSIYFKYSNWEEKIKTSEALYLFIQWQILIMQKKLNKYSLNNERSWALLRYNAEGYTAQRTDWRQALAKLISSSTTHITEAKHSSSSELLSSSSLAPFPPFQISNITLNIKDLRRQAIVPGFQFSKTWAFYFRFKLFPWFPQSIHIWVLHVLGSCDVGQDAEGFGL